MAARRRLTVDEYVAGVLAGDRATLGRAITLIESDAPQHQAQAQELLRRLLPHSGRSIRVGITGVPGVGKSTFIEALGTGLCERGRRVAVLAIDPSSSLTRGSILGDKTRMERLSQHPHAFIRPSPTGGAMGGVARKTRESLLICEAAGFDIVLVETVGVGQSEVAVRSMTDCFVLLALAGAGDELQAIKKGVVELADLIVITKADGDNRVHAQAARADYLQALRYLAPATEGWRARVLTSSAVAREGIVEVWETVEEFHQTTMANGALAARRREQARGWLHTLIREALELRFYRHPIVAAALPSIEQEVLEERLTPGAAADELLLLFAGRGEPAGHSEPATETPQQ